MALPLTRLAAATGCLALALAAGMGAAAADPDPDPGSDSAVNTTCNYSQVVAAMNAQSPATAAQFNATPTAQSFLQQFLASPPPQREQMLEQAQAAPDAAPFVNMVEPLASTCNNY
ncbi:MAG TPA: hemophore-related protein [Mycobacterium sp.]